MKNKLTNLILFLLTFVAIITNLIIYIFLRKTLVPALVEIPPHINNLGAIVILSIIVIGIYHLYLLIFFLKTLNEESLSILAYYLVFLILSGITLFSVAALLSDIGKEYRLWDVSGEWNLLFGFTIFHLVTILIGFTLSLKHKPGTTSLWEGIKSARDIWFISLNKIGALCGILGIAVFAAALIIPIQERFRISLLLILSILVFLPWGSFTLYWFFKNRNTTPNTWLDEKLSLDSAAAALITLIISMPIIAVSIFVSATSILTLSSPFWLVLIFFIQLSTFSISILCRNQV